MKNKAKLVNLGAYKDKYYHFDFENKTLLEEVKPPNYLSYILVPITVYVLRFLMTGIEKTGIFESGSTRIFLVLFLLVISYLLAQWITKSYQSKLELQKSALDKHVLANFVKSLRRRHIVFLTLKSVIYLAILICAWLFLLGVLGDIFLLFLGILLSLFILNADYQLQKWADIAMPQFNVINNKATYALVKGQLKDMQKITLGGDYCRGERYRGFLSKLHYRAGISYSTPYITVNGQDGPKELSASMGLGIPIVNNYNYRSMLNIGFEWVNRNRINLINENMFRINVGLTFNERWFAKFKVR